MSGRFETQLSILTLAIVLVTIVRAYIMAGAAVRNSFIVAATACHDLVCPARPTRTPPALACARDIMRIVSN